MKKSALLLSFLVFSGLAFTSCKKDDDPTFKEQVTGHWASQEVEIDNSDATSIFSSVVHLENDGSFTLRVTFTDPFSGQTTINDHSGNWVESDSDQRVTLNFNNAPTQIWTITNLADESMRASYTDSLNRRLEITFQKQ